MVLLSWFMGNPNMRPQQSESSKLAGKMIWILKDQNFRDLLVIIDCLCEFQKDFHLLTEYNYVWNKKIIKINKGKGIEAVVISSTSGDMVSSSCGWWAADDSNGKQVDWLIVVNGFGVWFLNLGFIFWVKIYLCTGNFMSAGL